jgi:hypothetical protein
MNDRTITEPHPVPVCIKFYDVADQQVDATMKEASQRPANRFCTLFFERNIQPGRLIEVTIARADQRDLGFTWPQPSGKDIRQDRPASSSAKNQDAFHGVLFLALRFAFQPLPHEASGRLNNRFQRR